jgi:hypothetical protein
MYIGYRYSFFTRGYAQQYVPWPAPLGKAWGRGGGGQPYPGEGRGEGGGGAGNSHTLT